jgi:dipeptidyl aminopeptidase/acylaminoacyl peptidase
MPDTHEDIRRRLFDAAWETPAYAPAPQRTVSRARRRAATTLVGGALAVILAVVVGASSFDLGPKEITGIDPTGTDEREFLIDISSGRVTEISGRSIMEGASWISASPDGKQVAFTKEATGSWQLFVANLDGSEMRQLTEGLLETSEPAWSPSGTRIAYVGLGSDATRNVHVVHVATGRSRRITDEQSDVWSPQWSPDGRSILYGVTVRAENPETVEGVFLFNTASQQLRAADVATGRSRKLFGGRETMAYEGAWMEDGIAFLRGRELTTQGPKRLDLVLLRTGETRPEVLVEIPIDMDEAVWGTNASPDGSTIAFARHLEGRDRIVLVDVATGRARVLRTGTEVSWVDDDTLLVQDAHA